MTESNETPALPGAGGSGVHLQGRMKARAAATSAIAFEPPRFPLVSFEDIKPSLQRSYLVKGLLPREGLVVVWGAPKSGKSFWVFDLAMHIALGWEYRGRRVTQGAVVYVACEGEAGFKLRVEAFRRANAMQLASHGAPVPFFLVPTRLDLAKDGQRLIRDIKAKLGCQSPAVVVVDTLNRSLAGSESSDVDMAAYIAAADAIKEAFHCAVVIVHHCGHDPKKPRGHSSLTGAVDAQIAITRERGQDSFFAKVEYMKDGEEGTELLNALKIIDLDPDEDGEIVTSCVVIEPQGLIPRTSRGKAKSLADGPKRTLDFLLKLISETGESLPAEAQAPAGTQGASKQEWENQFLASPISKGAKESKKRAFRRNFATLQKDGLVGVWDDWVWVNAPTP